VVSGVIVIVLVLVLGCPTAMPLACGGGKAAVSKFTS